MTNDNIDWIKELVKSEEQMEQAGLVNFSPVVNTENLILSASVEFLKEIKAKFINNANVFNKIKGANTHGGIKIYGIAKTHADFMLFRNGYKLVFTLLKPGKIQIGFHHMSTPFLNSPEDLHKNQSPIKECLIQAAWGAFQEIRWVSDSKPVNQEHLVKHYLRNFVQNSTK